MITSAYYLRWFYKLLNHGVSLVPHNSKIITPTKYIKINMSVKKLSYGYHVDFASNFGAILKKGGKNKISV